MKQFKRNLKVIRMRNTLSQTELSKKTGLEPSHISHFECGRRVPSVKNLIKLAKALNCTMEELVIDEKDNA